MRPSFDGDIPEIPGIAVDNFSCPVKRAYFLSHCHTDHTHGLSRLLKDIQFTESVFIYMSEPSAAIVQLYIEPGLKGFIKPLKLGSTTITLPADAENDESYIQVTLIPAGHCFGSVMFLFETPLKKILYTGDFRISENSVRNMAQLHTRDGKPIELDALYVDTTFQDEKFMTFPKRSEVITEVVREIDSWLKTEAHRVALATSARYGYENIFNRIYERTNMKVFVDDDSNWELYRMFLDRLPGVTNDKNETKIHLCKPERWRAYCKTCKKISVHQYLYIQFSAMRWTKFNPEDMAIERAASNVLNVCFATHCSRSELVYFIEYLSPKKIVGFPDPFVPREPNVVTVTPSKRKLPKQNEVNFKRSNIVPEHILKKIFE